jgi:hypothetical protein
VVIDQALRDCLQGVRGGAALGENVDAVPVAGDHAAHATDLALDLAQASQVLGFVVEVADRVGSTQPAAAVGAVDRDCVGHRWCLLAASSATPVRSEHAGWVPVPGMGFGHRLRGPPALAHRGGPGQGGVRKVRQRWAGSSWRWNAWRDPYRVAARPDPLIAVHHARYRFEEAVMLTFLSTNWFWLLLIGAMLFMHLGHGGHGGGCGGHGENADTRTKDRAADDDSADHGAGGVNAPSSGSGERHPRAPAA